MGSKAAFADELSAVIQERIDMNGIEVYIEPFMGGCNIADRIWCDRVICADVNKYLVGLFREVQSRGVDIIPKSIDRAEWESVRDNMGEYDDWYVGAVGYFGSRNGRFFDGGYAQSSGSRDYYVEARNNFCKQILNWNMFDAVEFRCCDYRELDCRGAFVYCDPPYAATKGYSAVGRFDHQEFWDWVRGVECADILVSEEHAPVDFKTVWEKRAKRTFGEELNTKKVTEKLYER